MPKVIPSLDHVTSGGGAPVARHCNRRDITAVVIMSSGPGMFATGRATRTRDGRDETLHHTRVRIQKMSLHTTELHQLQG